MWNYLKTATRPIVLYGTGNAAEKIIAELTARQIPIAGIFASDGFVRNRSFAGFPVLSYQEACERFPGMIVLLCFGSHRPDVIDLFRKIDREQELYAPDLPIAGDGLFTAEYAKAHEKEIAETSALLADELSRRVLQDCIDYKISGKIRYLFDCETPDEENWKLLRIGPEEIYMDLGAYTGDTVRQFLTYTDTYRRIYAVEPDTRNFRKLTEYAGSFPDCTLIRKAISDGPGTMAFSKNAGRGGGKGKGKVLVEADSIDGILNGTEVSLIKFDLEGQEPAALRGGAETIRRFRPKMLIAAYHRTDDLWEIPRKVLSLNPVYQVYLRKSPGIPAWEINYYFV